MDTDQQVQQRIVLHAEEGTIAILIVRILLIALICQALKVYLRIHLVVEIAGLRLTQELAGRL